MPAKKKGKKGGAKAAKGGRKAPAPKAKAAKSASPAKPKGKAQPNGKEKPKEKPPEKQKTDLTPLKKKAEDGKATFEKARTEADALRTKAKELEAAAKKAYAEAVAPYRDACRKAGVECEFAGARAANVTPAVRFLVEKVKDGVKVTIKDRPETEEIISKKSLDESIGKAAFAYTDKWIGPRDTIGAKGAGLSNRLRAALRKS
jgi:hypothetical protein